MTRSEKFMMRIFETQHRDYSDVLTIYCGQTHERVLPNDLLRLILTMSGLVALGDRSIMFKIFFPSVFYKECQNVVQKRRDRVRKRVVARPAAGSPR